jgi:putative membrane protein
VRPVPDAAHETTPAPVPSPERAAAPKPLLSTPERIFASTAAAHGIYEIEASQLAITRSANAQVKAYAQMLATQRADANRELAVFMHAKGMTPPKGLAADKLTKLHRLESLSGNDFDRGFVRSVGIDDHTADIALFERAGREAGDRALKAWIDRTLATLRNQQIAAQTLAAALAK